MNLQNVTIMPAMVTPFDETAQIDYKKLSGLIDFLIETGSEGILVGGTTGESPTLSQEEKLSLYKETVKLVNGRVPIMAGTGSNNTAETIAFTKQVAEINGIDVALVVVPYYNKPSQKGLYEHFKAVSEASDLPIVLYNVPGRTGTNLAIETTIELAKLPNIIGIKECAGLEAMAAIIEGTAQDFLVYSGEDALALSTKMIGGQGIITVAGHLYGKDMQKMYHAFDQGDLVEAGRIQRKLIPKINHLFGVTASPAPVKAGLNRLNVPVGGVRLPLIVCTKEEQAIIEQDIADKI